MFKSTPIAQGQEHSTTAANSGAVQFSTGYDSIFFYVVIRDGLWKYYPLYEELQYGNKRYSVLDGIYHYARTTGRTRVERQALANQLMLDILTWHEHVASTDKCQCGARAKLQIDPYNRELNCIETYKYLCKKCYRTACEDI